MRKMDYFTIGKLASEAGVGIETIRYYEKKRVLPEPTRLPSGYRQYSYQTVQRIRFIKRAQSLGFTLKEISQLLSIADGETIDCEEVRGIALRKLSEIDGKLNHLRRLKEVLSDLAEKCAEKDNIKECPIIESLTKEE